MSRLVFAIRQTETTWDLRSFHPEGGSLFRSCNFRLKQLFILRKDNLRKGTMVWGIEDKYPSFAYLKSAEDRSTRWQWGTKKTWESNGRNSTSLPRFQEEDLTKAREILVCEDSNTCLLRPDCYHRLISHPQCLKFPRSENVKLNDISARVCQRLSTEKVVTCCNLLLLCSWRSRPEETSSIWRGIPRMAKNSDWSQAFCRFYGGDI